MKKYKLDTPVKTIIGKENVNSKNISEIGLKAALKEYRLEKSRQEKIKPYYIFNDKQLEDLITKMPRDREELLLVSGFGEIKVEKYGNDILKILCSYK